jgi:predicted secreted hydrolase
MQMIDSAVTDVRQGRYHFDGRQYSFDAPAVLPGAFDFAIGSERVKGGDGRDQVHSEVDGYAIDLDLVSTATPVLHLADGYVNYYSREMMRASGTIVAGGKVHHVHGTTWFDHQFGPQVVELATVQNWTWIAAQLEGDRQLLALIVNRQDGSQLAIGSYTRGACGTTQLGPDDFSISALDEWSPSDSCTYPFGWKVEVPGLGLSLEVTPFLKEQDILVPGVDHYYEADSSVSGSASGRAYVELFGFCAP